MYSGKEGVTDLPKCNLSKKKGGSWKGGNRGRGGELRQRSIFSTEKKKDCQRRKEVHCVLGERGRWSNGGGQSEKRKVSIRGGGLVERGKIVRGEAGLIKSQEEKEKKSQAALQENLVRRGSIEEKKAFCHRE